MNDYSIINIKNLLNIETMSLIIFNHLKFENLKKDLKKDFVKTFFINNIVEVHFTTQEEFLKKDNGKVIIFKK